MASFIGLTRKQAKVGFALQSETRGGVPLKRLRPMMQLGEWKTMRETLPEKCETGKLRLIDESSGQASR